MFTLTEHQFLPSSQDCFEDIFIGKWGRTKGEYKYACVDVELKCLCCCYSISLLSLHKYEWNRLNDCRNETSFGSVKMRRWESCKLKLPPPSEMGSSHSCFSGCRSFPSPLPEIANPEFPDILVINILEVFIKSALWIGPRETTLKTTETGWLHARSITLLYALTFWDAS